MFLANADGGPIYVMGPQPSSEMAYNYVAHALHHAAMLYHDEGSAYWRTHHNVVNSQPGGGCGAVCMASPSVTARLHTYIRLLAIPLVP